MRHEQYEIVEDVVPMKLSKLLEGVVVKKMFQTTYGQMIGTHDVEVNSIHYDSRLIARDDIFVAIRGTERDGHKFIADAVNNGAKIVVLEDETVLPDSFFMHAGVIKIVVPNSRVALAQMVTRYYDNPSDKLLLVGVTGTNGKTTTTYLIKSILELSGNKTGLTGTIEYQIGDQRVPATHTTPESSEINQLLARMVEAKCSSAVMEVSSHALHQYRVHGLKFKVAVFTNLTQDHLDYHGSMEEYFNAKKVLFSNMDSNSWAIVNIDDGWGRRMLPMIRSKAISYGVESRADVRAKNISLSMQGIKMTASHRGEETAIDSSLLGRFNVSNILAAFGTGIALGISKSILKEAIHEMKSIPGRFEPFVSAKGWTAIIDYAHSPDALQKALVAVHDVFNASRKGRVLTVFGCGGNRDRTKRPKMAQIATKYSDITILTSDNPRHENPETIIDEVVAGVTINSKVYREPDRKKAVIMALELAGPNDVVLIAGKGHEDYQIIGDQKIHFSDRKIVEEFIRLHA